MGAQKIAALPQNLLPPPPNLVPRAFPMGKALGTRLGGGGSKFWGRAAIFWAPIWGGLKLSGPAFRGGLQFLSAFGRCAGINGFCVTEILSTA